MTTGKMAKRTKQITKTSAKGLEHIYRAGVKIKNMYDFSYTIECINLLSSYEEVIETYNWVVDSFTSLDKDIEGITCVIDFIANGIKYSGASMDEFKVEAFGSEVEMERFTVWTKNKREMYLNFHVSKRKAAATDNRATLLAHDKDHLIRAVDMLNYKKGKKNINGNSRTISFVSLPKISESGTNMLLNDIYRSLENDEPELVLDRLHTFSMRFLKGICEKNGIDVLDNKGNGLPMQSLLGKIKNYILGKCVICSEFTKTALSANISIIDKYNYVRNQESFAHDNQVMDKIEAKYAIKTIANILVLLSEIDASIDNKGKST